MLRGGCRPAHVNSFVFESEGEQAGLLSSPGHVGKAGQNMAYIVSQVFLYDGSES